MAPRAVVRTGLAAVVVALAGCGQGDLLGGAPVAVALTPGRASVEVGATQQFTASVTGTADTAVAWSVREGAAGGAVSVAGLYTAPATTGTFHVVATSHAEADRAAVAEVTVTPAPVAVGISPAEAALLTGRSRQFTASVSGTADTAVWWSVREGSAGGVVTSEGRYTAPAAAGTYHVVVTSQANPARQAAATVTVTEVEVSIAPASAALVIGQVQPFTATVTGADDTAVAWSVEEGAGGGTITSGGLYTAPASPGTFHVVATSQADPARSARAAVTVSPPPVTSVTVAPATAALLTGATQAFTASVTGGTSQAVTWSVQEGAAGGTVTADGRYTAPSTPGTYHVVATSQADPAKAGAAVVTVTAVGVSVSPATAALLTGRTQQFTAAVSGSADTAVAWSVQEGAAGGAVTAAGLYTAPAAPGTYHVVATSHADPARAGAATVTVTQVAVAVAPGTATLATGRTQQFTATVTGTLDAGVAWSVLEGAAGGAVTSGGLYTAPGGGGTFHVVATSLADPARSASATVTVVEVRVSVSPDTATLVVGDTLRLTATVTGSPDGAVTWSVLEGAGCGAVVGGRYTAPDTPGTCHVVATSVADPTRSASAELTVAAAPPASLWQARLGIGVVDGGPRAGTWDLDPAGHADTLIVVQTPNAETGTKRSLDVFFGPVGGPMAQDAIPVDAASGVAQVTAVMDTAAYKLHLLAPAGNLFSMLYLRAAVLRDADGRITGFAKEAEVAFSPPAGNVYGNALIEVVDGAGQHRLAGLMTVDAWYTTDSWVYGFVTSPAGGVAPGSAAHFTGFGGGPLDALATFQHTGGAGALDGAYGCMGSVVQQPTTRAIYAFAARGLHGDSTGFHRLFPIPLAAPGATTWAPAAAINYSDTGTGSNYAFALPSGHVYWSWEDGTDSRLSRVNPDGSLNLSPLPALGFRAEFNPGACHVAVQGDRVMTILHEWGVRARVYLATGVDHDAPGTSPVAWQVTELQDPVTDQYPLLATGIDGLGRSGGHWWTALLVAHYSAIHVESWLVVAPFP